MTPLFPDLISTLVERTEAHPDALAVRFLEDGENIETCWSREKLFQRASTIGRHLAERTTPGDRALLLYPPGPDYIAAFFGCLAARVIAVPAYPPDPMRLERTLPRLVTIARDCQPAVALSTQAICSIAPGLFTLPSERGDVPWVATDVLEATDGSLTRPKAEDVAFLQYTSGSTAQPRGVVLTHANLMANLAAIRAFLPDADESNSFVWLPPYHDMGLIGGILEPLYAGFPMGLMSPLHFLQRPARWLDALSRYRVTFSAGPAFAFDLCVRKTTPEQRARLDLSAWAVAFNGAEPIHPATLDRFMEAFAPAGFRETSMVPCYGLAEGTLIVSGQPKRQAAIRHTLRTAALEDGRAEPAEPSAEARTLVSCGPAVPTARIAITEPEGSTPLPDNIIGEIRVSGPSIASSYWDRADHSRVTFEGQIDGRPGTWLRTGDLGYLRDGELFVTGRMKDLIIIGGRNLHPQDLERTACEADSRLRPGSAAAFAWTTGEREAVVLVVEATSKDAEEVEALQKAVRAAVIRTHSVVPHDVRVVPRHTVPRTSSGKVQRFKAREVWRSMQ